VHGLRIVVMMNRVWGAILVLAAGLFASGCSFGPHFTPQEQARYDSGTDRWVQVRAMVEAQEYDAATEPLVKFWLETTDPDRPRGTLFYGNLSDPIRTLTREHPPAREQFLEAQQPLRQRVMAGETGRGETSIWLELNAMLRDEDSFEEYVTRFITDAKARDQLRWREYRAFDRLVARNRWDLAGFLVEENPAESMYARPTPALLKPLEVIAVLPLLPVVVPLGGMIAPRVAPNYPFDMFTREREQPPSPERIAAAEASRLRKAAMTGAALTAAGRDAEARELYRRARRRTGDDAAALAFREAFDLAGVGEAFPPGR
jgi:hypothetical protein